MARSRELHDRLDAATFAGAVKLRCEELDMTLAALATVIGLQPNTIRARLSKSRGKRSLQPAQVSAIATALKMDPVRLHRLAAAHEGWKIEDLAA